MEKEKVVFLETKGDIFIVKYDDILFAVNKREDHHCLSGGSNDKRRQNEI